jgi:hypothetical protein
VEYLCGHRGRRDTMVRPRPATRGVALNGGRQATTCLRIPAFGLPSIHGNCARRQMRKGRPFPQGPPFVVAGDQPPPGVPFAPSVSVLDIRLDTPASASGVTRPAHPTASDTGSRVALTSEGTLPSRVCAPSGSSSQGLPVRQPAPPLMAALGISPCNLQVDPSATDPAAGFGQ